MKFGHLAFCFGVWGENPKYNVGIIKAINSVHQFFPGAHCIVFDETNAPMGVPDKGCWRLTASSHPPSGVTHFLYRDADSRITMREYFAILEWLASGKKFHFMRDHPFHHHPILGGMWGHVADPRFHIPALLDKWIDTHKEAGYGVNESFLAEYVWPYAKSYCLEHGSFNQEKYPNQIAFPTDRFNIPTVGFVGEILDENDKPCDKDRAARVVAL